MERGSFRARLLDVLAKGALLLASMAVSLAMGEVAVRAVAPQQLIQIRPDIWMPRDSVGWAHRPHVNTRINTGERSVDVITDQDGFRVGREGRIEADTQVLLIGDSFMAALQVEQEQSLPGLIEANSVASLGRRVAVRNAAVGAWDPPQYLIEARRRLRENRYDLMIVSVFLGNDIVPRRIARFSPREPEERAPFRLPRALKKDQFVRGVAQPTNDFLEERSHLFLLLRTSFRSLLVRQGLSAGYFPENLKAGFAGARDWEVTADILGEIADLAEARGVPTLFVLIPDHVQIHSDRLTSYVRDFGVNPGTIDVDQPDRIMAGKLSARGLRVVDAIGTFRAAAAAGNTLYGTVDPHLSPAGHQALWTLLRPILAEELAGGMRLARTPRRSTPPAAGTGSRVGS